MGLDVNGLDVDGLDVDGLDVDGLDVDGLDIDGLDVDDLQNSHNVFIGEFNNKIWRVWAYLRSRMFCIYNINDK